MTSASSPRPVSALRARMIEDMTVRGFTEETHSNYICEVRAFAAFIRRPPDRATAEDLRRFQLHQTQSGMPPPSINSSVSALRFFFTVTLDRPDLARRLTVVRQPRRLPAVLSVEEITLLLQAAPGPKYKAAFATAGARPGEGRGRRAARLCRPGHQATAHSRAESRGSRPSTAAPGERRTLRWREPDSNHRSRVRKSGRCQVPAIRPGSVEH